ncbi:MAG: hypothetical protein H5T97_08020, partial [Firmicutes bacterium]|nr:hypothetical protein [Bacillota bacterium]
MWRRWAEAGGGWPPWRLLWLVGAGILGIALLVLGNLGGSAGSPTPEQKGDGAAPAAAPSGEVRREEEALAASLEALLAQVRGVGEVRVAVRLEGSTESD